MLLTNESVLHLTNNKFPKVMEADQDDGIEILCEQTAGELLYFKTFLLLDSALRRVRRIFDRSPIQENKKWSELDGESRWNFLKKALPKYFPKKKKANDGKEYYPIQRDQLKTLQIDSFDLLTVMSLLDQLYKESKCDGYKSKRNLLLVLKDFRNFHAHIAKAEMTVEFITSQWMKVEEALGECDLLKWREDMKDYRKSDDIIKTFDENVAKDATPGDGHRKQASTVTDSNMMLHSKNKRQKFDH